jgi:hypothetical protein
MPEPQRNVEGPQPERVSLQYATQWFDARKSFWRGFWLGLLLGTIGLFAVMCLLGFLIQGYR